MTVLRPTSDTTTKNIENPGGTHYNQVYEAPETPISTVDSTYVINDSTYGATQYDLYNVTPYNSDSEYGTGTVSNVITKYRARREMHPFYTVVMAGEAWDTINIGGSNGNGPQISLSTLNSWYAFSHEWSVAPDNGAWDLTKVNNLKIGVTLSNHYCAIITFGRSNVLCSQVYAEVYYMLNNSW